ncbi:MAG: hypothetical protein EOM90_17080 [Alphaproteobacteria bacterium]|nr:hypothetical protein [Alphaproteobacteria bacterium]
MKKIGQWLFGLMLLAIANSAFAEVFCVDTAEELQAALTTASSNGQDDEVQIVQGTYVGNFVYATATEAYDLAVKGGYTTGCTSQVIDPTNTTLDGNQSGTVLVISADFISSLLLQGLSMQNGNRLSNDGGGLYIRAGNDSRVNVVSNIFKENVAKRAAGIMISKPWGVNLDVSLINNVIKNNHALVLGGGAWIIANNLVFSNNMIEENSCSYTPPYCCGGGVNIDPDGLTVFSNNAILSNNGCGAFINNSDGGTVKFIGNLIDTNEGGGLNVSSYFRDGITIFINNTFHKNIKGPGLRVDLGRDENLSHAIIFNNLFWSNGDSDAQDKVTDLWIDNDYGNDFISVPITLRSNNFDQTAGTGYFTTLPITIDPSNLNKVDPLFVDPDNGDLHLQSGSPMINAGYPDTPDLPSTDFEGNPRIVGGRVDIGAYEFDDGTRYNLTTVFQGNGFGRVTSNPTGIDCGSDCDHPFPPLKNVVLTGTPDNSSTFVGWSGADCSGTAPCTVTMDANKTVSANFALSGSGEPALNAAVLPYARAIGMGETATAFGTLINSGTLTATGCALALPAGIPATFSYQTTDAGNALNGTPNTPVSIPAGAVQQFVFGITPTATFTATEIPVVFDCTNSAPAPSHTGVNTFILSASSSVPADLVAIASTVNNDGIVQVDPSTGIGFFATAAVNIGSTGTIQVQADDGERVLPLTLEICETTASGQRIGSCASRLTRTVNADETVYYTVNVFASQGVEIPFDPAFNRLYLRFVENGTTVGATNVAVTTE